MWQGAQVYREEKGRGLVSVGMIGWSSSSLSGMRWTGVVLFPSHFCGCCCRAVASEQITNKKTNRRGDRCRADEATVGGGKAQLSPSKGTLWETSGLTNPIPEPWRRSVVTEPVRGRLCSILMH